MHSYRLLFVLAPFRRLRFKTFVYHIFFKTLKERFRNKNNNSNNKHTGRRFGPFFIGKPLKTTKQQ